jgi:hypothetical protein
MLLIIAGCSSLHYAPQSDRPSATLTLRNAEGVGQLVLNAFQKTDCRDAGKYVKNSTLRPGEESVLAVEAARDFSFRVQTLRPVTARTANLVASNGDVTVRLNACDAAGTFLPKPGGRYSAIFTDVNGSCRVVVVDDSTTRPVDSFVPKKWFTSGFTEGWHCSPF